MTVSRAPTVLSALFALSFSSATAQVNPSPRAAYWQQGVRYDINAKLDESRFELAGTEMIEYVNNSPDTLTTFSLGAYASFVVQLAYGAILVLALVISVIGPSIVQRSREVVLA